MPGFKNSEIGPIPDDWELLPLGQILRNARLGGNYPNSRTETEHPLMKMGNVVRGRFDVSSVEYIPPDRTPDEMHRLQKGDVIFNTRNTLELVGKVAIWNDELPVAYFNSNIMKLEFDERLIASNSYANLALNTKAAIAQLRALATGTTSVAAIYTRDLLKLPVLTPPLREQCAIAEVLSQVDDAITGLSRLLAKKRDLRTAVTQRLLTGRVRLPGFNAPWHEQRLGELGGTYGGLTGKTKDDFGSGNARYVTFLNVVLNPIVDPTAFDLVRITSNERQNSVLHGDILFNGSSETPEEVALCSYVDIQEVNLFLNSFCFGYRLRAPERINGRFLVHYLRSDAGRRLVKELAQGSTRYNISKTSLLKVEVPVPEIEEQEAIVSTISDFDAEITALKVRLEKTRALRQAMMQALLTGRVRLPVPEEETREPEAVHA